MAFVNATNYVRVKRMVEFLDLIEASAASNRAGPMELAEMLRPLLDRLGAYVPAKAAAEAAVPSAPPKPGSHAAWNTIRQMAEEAPLADLTVALAVYLSRIGEHLEGH